MFVSCFLEKAGSEIDVADEARSCVVTKVYPFPGYCATVLTESQKFPVRVWGSYRTFRSSGYGTEVLLTEVPGIVARAYRTHKSYESDIPVPRVFVALAYRTS